MNPNGESLRKEMPALVPRLKGIESRIIGVINWLETKKKMTKRIALDAH